MKRLERNGKLPAFLLFFVTIFGVVLHAAPPAWVLNKPVDTAQSFYGVGAGYTLQEASDKARAAIAARIQATVSSERICETMYSNFSGNEDLVEKCRETSASQAKQTLTNTEVRKSARDDGEWYVLIEADRNALFAAQKRKLDKNDRQLQREWSAYEAASAFEKIKLSTTIDKLLGSAEQSLPLLAIYQPGFNGGDYRQRYRMYRDSIRSTYGGATVTVKADAISQPLADLVREALSKENIKLTKKNPDSVIYIRTGLSKRMLRTTRYPQFFGVKRKAIIDIQNKKGVSVSQNQVCTKAGSPRSYEEAIGDTRKYRQMIDRYGVIAFLTGGEGGNQRDCASFLPEVPASSISD